MIKRQVRIQRLGAITAEFRAAKTASALLNEELKANPNYGERNGWTQRAGRDFQTNLESTYIVRLYAEFEATLRDYWKNCLGRDTEPPMVQLVNLLIPDQHFPQDYIDGANEVRISRNYLVHGSEDDPPLDAAILDIHQAERRLRAYVSRLQADW
jgi:hypothetical protein